MGAVTNQARPSPDRLRTFGELGLERYRLEGGPALTPQQLLLLAYVSIECPPSRRELAMLFWPHLSGEFTKKGERKHLSNLGVALAVLRRELGFDLEQRDAITCDAVDFEAHQAGNEPAAALELYRRGRFLHDIEHKPRLKLGQELLDWVTQRREGYDRGAQLALLTLADAALASGQLERARGLTEEAYRVDAGGRDPVILARLRALLRAVHSPLADALGETIGANLRLALSPEALRLYLVLCLQEHPNLAAAQHAAELSVRSGAYCLEELRGAGLLLPDESLFREPGRRHLETHPAEQMALLSALREHTPPEQAYPIYRDIFMLSHTFGGVGYWERARLAYGQRARSLIVEQDFAGAATVLAQFQRAEFLDQQTPHPENRFLLAYALERLRRFEQGLESLEGVAETPEVLAIRAALLVHTGDLSAARESAERVARDPLATPWAKAIALNAAGQVAVEDDRLLDAEVAFDQAGVMWSLAGHRGREIGALVNRANVLERLGQLEEARRTYEEVLRRAGGDHILRTRTLLNLGYAYERLEHWTQAHDYYQQAQALCDANDVATSDGALAASVLNNLGYAQWKLQRHDAARASLTLALPLARDAGDRRLYGVALGNLGLIESSVGKLEMALGLLEQFGNQRDLEDYSALYETMLETLATDAEGQGTVQTTVFYLGKLMAQLARRGQSERAAVILQRLEGLQDSARSSP
jgi:tetratricopeptide (TPR) repeat protein